MLCLYTLLKQENKFINDAFLKMNMFVTCYLFTSDSNSAGCLSRVFYQPEEWKMALKSQRMDFSEDCLTNHEIRPLKLENL